jgi:serine phosphatase RsbU (regulator of sigma subunit)
VDDLAHLPAAALADALFTAIDEFNAGRAQDDDQTLMIVKGVGE